MAELGQCFKFIDHILETLVSSLKTDHHSQKKWDSFNSDQRLLHGILFF